MLCKSTITIDIHQISLKIAVIPSCCHCIPATYALIIVLVNRLDGHGRDISSLNSDSVGAVERICSVFKSLYVNVYANEHSYELTHEQALEGYTL